MKLYEVVSNKLFYVTYAQIEYGHVPTWVKQVGIFSSLKQAQQAVEQLAEDGEISIADQWSEYKGPTGTQLWDIGDGESIVTAKLGSYATLQDLGGSAAPTLN
jgi:hypothetical protein